MKKNKILTFKSCKVDALGMPGSMSDLISDSLLDKYQVISPNSAKEISCSVNSTHIIPVGDEILWSLINGEQEIRDLLWATVFKNSLEGQAVDETVENFILKQYIFRRSIPEINVSSLKTVLVSGYACDETNDQLPAALWLGQKIKNSYQELIKTGEYPFLSYFARCKVDIEFDESRKFFGKAQIEGVKKIEFLVFQPSSADAKLIQRIIGKQVIWPIINDLRLCKDFDLQIQCVSSIADTRLLGENFAGETSKVESLYGRLNYFVKPVIGAMLTENGIVTQDISNYRQPSINFSGNDVASPLRAGTYMARFLAKLIVKAKVARECSVFIHYDNESNKPISLLIDFHGTLLDNYESKNMPLDIFKHFDLSVEGIIKRFDLLNFELKNTAIYGHFGNENFPWEIIEQEDMDALCYDSPHGYGFISSLRSSTDEELKLTIDKATNPEQSRFYVRAKGYWLNAIALEIKRRKFPDVELPCKFLCDLITNIHKAENEEHGQDIF